MRRITFALLLLAATGWATPSRAQWWGGGRAAFGSCGPWTCPGGGWAGPPGRLVVLAPVQPFPAQRFWAGPGRWGAPRFAAPGWGWRRWALQRWAWQRWAWRRDMRLRRIANWHRWVEAESQAAERQAAERQAAEREPARVEEAPPRFRRWTRWARPSRFAAEVATGGQRPAARPVQADGSAEAAVAMMPALGARFARPTHAAVQSRILAAAMIRHPVVPAPHPMVPPPVPAPAVLPAVIHGPRAPVRPENAALRHPRAAAVAERRDPRPAVLRPVVLKSQPAPAVAAEPAALPVPPAPAVQSPAAPADVPVAPLD